MRYPECPHCGESVAKPVTVRSKEWQGDEAHGGIVEHKDDMCDLCFFESELRDTERFTEEEIAGIVAERKAELLKEAGVRP